MRTPRTLIAAIVSICALAFTPAFADEAKTVEIQVNLDASASDMYRSIREQAWTACKPDTGSHFVAARTTARRACQKALIADVVAQLPNPELVQLAQQDGIRAES